MDKSNTGPLGPPPFVNVPTADEVERMKAEFKAKRAESAKAWWARLKRKPPKR